MAHCRETWLHLVGRRWLDTLASCDEPCTGRMLIYVSFQLRKDRASIYSWAAKLATLNVSHKQACRTCETKTLALCSSSIPGSQCVCKRFASPTCYRPFCYWQRLRFDGQARDDAPRVSLPMTQSPQEDRREVDRSHSEQTRRKRRRLLRILLLLLLLLLLVLVRLLLLRLQLLLLLLLLLPTTAAAAAAQLLLLLLLLLLRLWLLPPPPCLLLQLLPPPHYCIHY